ncbi:MAG TPA: glycosyltransferase family 4 protein, partial [Dehalococcoidia bacterium]|nr:glycosyltransferase family 4 protein [Dehalococcoidia bacterium]
MEIKANKPRHLTICMLLPLTYEPNMFMYPRIKIFSELVHFSHEVTWIISSNEETGYQQLFINDTEVHTIPRHRYFPGNSILAEGLNEIFHAIRRMRFTSRLFKSSKYDIVYTRHSAKRPFDGLIAAYIKRRYKVALVSDFPASLDQLRLGVKVENREPKTIYCLIAWVSKLLARRLLRQSDLILSVSMYLKDYLVEQGAPESRIMAVPEGVDVEVFANQDGREVIERYRLGGAKVIIYQGTLDKIRYLSLLLQAFLIVKQVIEDAKLLVVGEGSDKENLAGLAGELGVKQDVIFTGWVPQSEVPNFTAASDVGVSPIPPLSIYKVSSPVKLLEYMAMRKPVVANVEILDHKEVLEQSGGGILVPFTPQAFAEAMIELLDNSEKAAKTGQRGREWVVKNRSYEILAQQVEQRYLE